MNFCELKRPSRHKLTLLPPLLPPLLGRHAGVVVVSGGVCGQQQTTAMMAVKNNAGRLPGFLCLSFLTSLLTEERRHHGSWWSENDGGRRVGGWEGGRVTMPARMNGHEWDSMPTRSNSGDTDSTNRGDGQDCRGRTGV